MRAPRPAALAALALATLATGCAGAPKVCAGQPTAIDWRKVATPADRVRLRNWRQAWIEAQDISRQGGAGAAMDRDAALLNPDRALPAAALVAGTYRCRTLKLGGKDKAAPPLLTSDWSACRVSGGGEARTFAMDGVSRVSGYLFADTDAREIFLGTLVVGDETRAMRYGRDAQRDMAGIVERVGETQWRIAFPYPAFASTLDIIEIRPAG